MTCSFLPIRLQSLDRTPFNPQPKLTPNSFSAPLNHLTAFYSLPGMYHSLKLFWSSIVCSLLSASPTRMQPLWESGNVGLWAGMSWSLDHPSVCLKFPVQKCWEAPTHGKGAHVPTFTEELQRGRGRLTCPREWTRRAEIWTQQL